MSGYSTFPGLTNYGPVKIPGTDTAAYLGVWDREPNVWTYGLWSGGEDHPELIATGKLDLQGLDVTPAQVARVAFLLEVDYAS